MRGSALVLGALALGGAVVLLTAARWRRETQSLHQRLDRGRVAGGARVFDPASVSELPAPVRRYLTLVLPSGRPLPTGARFTHRGELALGEGAPRWAAFHSRQRVVVDRPGFVWDARVRVAGPLAVRVHDAYALGEGLLHAALLGVPLARVAGTAEIAEGELQRWLAEGPWTPSLLLPSARLRWEPIDAGAARAALADGATRVALEFHFGGDGLIARVFAPARPRMVDGRAVPTAWEGTFSTYAERDGVRVPLAAEVAWLPPSGRRPYWRGNLETIAFDRADD